jgi:hypothetical protein
LDSSGRRITAKATITADIDPGTGYVSIPLPFSIDRARRVILEPDSAAIPILRADIRTAQGFGVIVIPQRSSSSRVTVVAERIDFTAEDTSRRGATQSIRILVSRASTLAAAELPDSSIAELEEVRLRSSGALETAPESLVADRSSNERILRRGQNLADSADIVVYFSQPPLVTQFGILLLMAAGLPVFIQARWSRPKTWRTTIVRGVLGVLGGGVLLLGYLFLATPDQRQDYTVTGIVGVALAIAVSVVLNAALAGRRLWLDRELRAPSS